MVNFSQGRDPLEAVSLLKNTTSSSLMNHHVVCSINKQVPERKKKRCYLDVMNSWTDWRRWHADKKSSTMKQDRPPHLWSPVISITKPLLSEQLSVEPALHGCPINISCARRWSCECLKVSQWLNCKAFIFSLFEDLAHRRVCAHNLQPGDFKLLGKWNVSMTTFLGFVTRYC